MVDDHPRGVLSIGISEFATVLPTAETPPGTRHALPFASARVEAVAGVLERFGYRRLGTQEPGGDTSDAMLDGIERAGAALGANGMLVVHVVSHGHLSDKGMLYVVGSDGRCSAKTDVGWWVGQFAEFDTYPRVLFLLDLCHAGAAARLNWQLSATSGEHRAWVIAACTARQSAFDGRFSQSCANVLQAFAESEVDIDPTRRFIPLDTIAREIQREVLRLATACNAAPQQVTGTLVDIAAGMPELPFFPNRGYSRDPRRRIRPKIDVAVTPFLDDVDESLDPGHFIERAAGYGELRREHGVGCFSGRRRELKILSAWFDGHDDVAFRVVTGSPGVGKSALLGVLVCAAHPVLREPTRPVWDHLDRAPFVNRRIAAVHARQRSTTDIVRSLGRQLGLVSDETELDPQTAIRQIAGRGDPPVIVVDALDEARDPETVMRALLLPLASARRPDGAAACRLMVAMRRWSAFGELCEVAEACGGLIDLDDVPVEQVRYDLEQYVNDLLRCCRPYDAVEYAGARAAFAAAVADALAGKTYAPDEQRWGEFLVAGLYAHHLVTSVKPVDDVRDAVRIGREVPTTLPKLLELDLAARAAVAWLRPILAALAHALGEGMPAQTLRRAATAFPLAGSAGGPDQQAIAQALQAARFYLRRATDTDGTTLYRLFHQGLADYLKDHPSGPDARPPAGATESRLLDALLQQLAADGSRDRRWDIAEPYLRRHAVTHAVKAGRAAELADDPELLIYADASAAVQLVRDQQVGWLKPSEYETVVSTVVSQRERRQALALAAARNGDSAAATRLANPAGQPALSWQPHWAAELLHDQPPASTPQASGPASGPASAIEPDASGKPIVTDAGPAAVVRLAEGPVAIVGNPTGGLDLHDPVRGSCQTVLRHQGLSPVSLAATTLRGEPIVVIGGADGTVHWWVPGVEQAVWLGQVDKPVHAVAGIPETVFAVTADADHLRLWSIERTAQLDDKAAMVVALHVVGTGHRALIVGIDANGLLRFWRVKSRGWPSPLFALVEIFPSGGLRSIPGAVVTVASASCAEGDYLVIGHQSGAISVYQVKDDGPSFAGSFVELRTPVALGCLAFPGRLAILVADGTNLHLLDWRPGDSTPAGDRLIGPAPGTTRIACVAIDDAFLAVTDGSESRIWHQPLAAPPSGSAPATTDAGEDPPDGAPHGATATACAPDGRVVALGHAGGLVTLRDGRDGSVIDTWQSPQPGAITCLHFADLGHRPVLCVGSATGTLSILDTAEPKPAGVYSVHPGRPIDSVTLTTFAGQPVALVSTAESACIVNLATGSSTNEVALPRGGAYGFSVVMLPERGATEVTFTKHGELQLVCTDKTVILQPGQRPPLAVFTIDGQTFAVDQDDRRCLSIWSLDTGRRVETYPIAAKVHAVRASGAGDLLVVTHGEAVMLRRADGTTEDQHQPPVPAPVAASADTPHGGSTLHALVTRFVEAQHRDGVAVGSELLDEDDEHRLWLGLHLALLRLPSREERRWRPEIERAYPRPETPVRPLSPLPGDHLKSELLLPAGDGHAPLYADAGALLEDVAGALGVDPTDIGAHHGIGVPVSWALAVARRDPELRYVGVETGYVEVEPATKAGFETVLRSICLSLHELRSLHQNEHDPGKYLRKMIDIDEHLRSLVHFPPAPANSWWGRLKAASYQSVLAAADPLVQAGSRVLVEELSGDYGALRRGGVTSGDDLRYPMPTAWTGQVLACLRLYSVVDGVARPGRVMFGVRRRG